MDDPFSKITAALESSLDPSTMVIELREGEQIEFKESFNWGSRCQYAKSMAAFSNNSGGYLIFGAANDPRKLVGLESAKFEGQDDAKMAEFLNSLFSPAIRFERAIANIAGKKVGLLWTAKHDDPPVMALKSADDVKEAEIYYRYNARTEKIRFAEMKRILDGVRARERSSWSELLSRIAKSNPKDLGIMDIAKGEIVGGGGNLLIDSDLIPQLNFIRQGQFEEGGEPTLKLVGEVTPIAAQRVSQSVRITDDPTAPAMRPEEIFNAYPLDYRAVLREASSRYSDFKANNAFHRLMKGIKKNPRYCHTRYLYPGRKSTPTNLYSRAIFDELDKRYARK